MEWVYLAKDKNKWLACLIMVMNFGFNKMQEIFFT